MTAVGRLPDVLIGGAPRCGTSWLHTVFANHPQIYVPVPFQPEPKFFLVDAEYAKGLAVLLRTVVLKDSSRRRRMREKRQLSRELDGGVPN